MQKKLIIATSIISILMLIAVIPLFILSVVFGINDSVGHILFCIWLPLLIVGLALLLLTLNKTISIIKENNNNSKDNIKIKAKHGAVFINTKENSLKYKKINVNLKDIIEIQLVNNQIIVDKSGVGESFVGGMLFGGSGAIAGAMVGKKQKLKDNYNVFIKTQNIKHAGIVITLRIDNAYNLFETLKLITKK